MLFDIFHNKYPRNMAILPFFRGAIMPIALRLLFSELELVFGYRLSHPAEGLLLDQKSI
jgi:hypothetical protein